MLDEYEAEEYEDDDNDDDDDDDDDCFFRFLDPDLE